MFEIFHFGTSKSWPRSERYYLSAGFKDRLLSKTVYFQGPYIFKDRIFSRTVYFQGPYVFQDRIFSRTVYFLGPYFFQYNRIKDGASCHTSGRTLDFISEWLPDENLISGRTGNHLTPDCLFWSPSSPDLSDRDNFLRLVSQPTNVKDSKNADRSLDVLSSFIVH